MEATIVTIGFRVEGLLYYPCPLAQLPGLRLLGVDGSRSRVWAKGLVFRMFVVYTPP